MDNPVILATVEIQDTGRTRHRPMTKKTTKNKKDNTDNTENLKR